MVIKYLDKFPKGRNARTLWVLKPMWVTLKKMFKTTFHRPVTIMYPYEKEWLPDNYRGRPGLIYERCVGCGVCMRMCPTKCIEIVDSDDNGKKVQRPQVNLGRCMMCGYCAEYCPVNAMIVTPDYELAAFTREELIYGPRKLAWPNPTPGMEVHLEEHLLSDPERGPVAYHITDRPELNAGKCIGCTKCVKVCPTDAVEMQTVGENDKGKPIKVPKFDVSRCICCENCVIECPKGAITIKEVL
ncbi:MAG: 4Fe-4S binding protein [Methanomassiliicoccaceae archaeon]|jgi:NADH-quinone oxidoreductase subunit I/NAD(P)H-quinone oxidoreductase subunit I|nr:4Fe-4S binding protein [Methanomassiliicoccaceae archaeon]